MVIALQEHQSPISYLDVQHYHSVREAVAAPNNLSISASHPFVSDRRLITISTTLSHVDGMILANEKKLAE